jgi:hypothetical protein
MTEAPPPPSRRPVAAPPSRPPRSLRGSVPQFPPPSRWERFIRWGQYLAGAPPRTPKEALQRAAARASSVYIEALA